MKRLAIVLGIVGASLASPALADTNIWCQHFGNMSYCSGTMTDGTYVSYSCMSLMDGQLDCTMTTPYYYHWVIDQN